ncbi:hypothetical protein TNCV_1989511 [Trichonephila clavipes]|nr:hypothetical protein TNCV_1989511 [Trichonephila clavipes]
MRNTRVDNRYHDTSRPQRESNRFGRQGFGDNRKFDSRRRSDQSDHRFNNHGGRQGSSRNGAFRGSEWSKPDDTRRSSLCSHSFVRNIHRSPVGHTGAEKSFISEEVYRRYFSYRPRQKTKDRVVTPRGARLLPLRVG